MSVANILKTPIVAPAITDPYANGGGSLPGLYLPLAGGTMLDTIPGAGAPIQNVNFIDGLYNLYGPNASGNQFTINAGPNGGSGNDLAFIASGNAIYSDAFQIENTATNEIINNAGKQNIIRNRLLVEKDPATMIYTVDDYAERIADYANDVGKQVGLLVQKTNSLVDDSTGIEITDIGTSLVGDACGLKIKSISAAPGFNAYGIFQDGSAGVMRNILQNRLEVGISESTTVPASDKPSLEVTGNIKNDIITFSSNYTLGPNSPYLINPTNALTIALSTFIVKGNTYKVFRTSTGTVTFSVLAGQSINGVAGPTTLTWDNVTYPSPAVCDIICVNTNTYFIKRY